MVNRRHIVIHNKSRVDPRYLKATKDISVRLNETVKINFADVIRTVEIRVIVDLIC